MNPTPCNCRRPRPEVVDMSRHPMARKMSRVEEHCSFCGGVILTDHKSVVMTMDKTPLRKRR